MKISRVTIGTLLLLLFGSLSLAQNVPGTRKDDVAIGSTGVPVANPTVRVCLDTATGVPCSPLASIYSDPGLTQPLTNPFTGDGIGNYHFYAVPGFYQIQLSGTGIIGTSIFSDVTLPNDPLNPIFNSSAVLTTMSFTNLASTPSTNPPLGTVLLYTKSDKNLYTLNDVGVETNISAGGGGEGSGSVTSVAFSGPGGIFSVSGSPITSSGSINLSVNGNTSGLAYFSNTGILSSSAALAQNFVIKEGPFSAPVISTIFDDGSNPTQTPNGLTTVRQGLFKQMPNAGSGTTQNLLVCENASGQAVTCSVSTVSGITGVAGPGAGVAGNVQVCIVGRCSAVFDNQTVILDWAISSATVPGQLHDTGSMSITPGVENFLVDSINSGANTVAQINLGSQDAIFGSLRLTGTGTTNTLPKFISANQIGNSLWTDNGTVSNYFGLGGIFIPQATFTGGGPFAISGQEGPSGSCPTPTSALDILCFSSTFHTIMISSDAGAYVTIGSGGGGGSPILDGQVSLSNKPSVALVSTSNLTLSGVQTIDGQLGVATTTIVLAVAQSTASQNGPWIMQTGAWTRPAWYPSTGTTQAVQFSTTFVRSGTVFQGSTWGLTTAAPITIDTTATTWAQIPLALNSNSVVGALPHANIANTAVTPGSYNAANITIAADGSITAAANGAGFPLSPIINGIYNCGFTVTASAIVAPTCPQVGLGGRSIIGGATSDTISFSDNAQVVDHDQSATGAVNQVLPTATTLTNPAFVYSYSNHSLQTDTITPTTWTIQLGSTAAGSSILVPPGAFVRIKIDPNNGSNWLADCAGCSVGTFTTLTLSGNGAASAPALSMTGLPYAGGTATTNFPLLYINNTGATATSSLSLTGTEFGINAATGTGQAIAVYNNGGPCTFCVSPAGAVVSAGEMLPTGGVQAGASIYAAAGSSNGFFGRSVGRSAADGRIAWVNNALTTNGLTRATFGLEAANNPAFAFDGSTSVIKTADGTGATTAGIFSSAIYNTDTNCSGVGTSASPSVVTCTAASAGSFSCATAATGATCTVNTTAAHTNSDIIVTQTASAGTRLGVTCNTTADAPTGPRISSISNGVSFTINLGTVTTNPACYFFHIVN